MIFGSLESLFQGLNPFQVVPNIVSNSTSVITVSFSLSSILVLVFAESWSGGMSLQNLDAALVDRGLIEELLVSRLEPILAKLTNFEQDIFLGTSSRCWRLCRWILTDNINNPLIEIYSPPILDQGGAFFYLWGQTSLIEDTTFDYETGLIRSMEFITILCLADPVRGVWASPWRGVCQRPQARAGAAVHPGDIRGLQWRGEEGALPCPGGGLCRDHLWWVSRGDETIIRYCNIDRFQIRQNIVSI